MKFAMRDNICKLMGKYESQLDSDLLKLNRYALPIVPGPERLSSEEIFSLDLHMMQLNEFLNDLRGLLEEGEKENPHGKDHNERRCRVLRDVPGKSRSDDPEQVLE